MIKDNQIYIGNRLVSDVNGDKFKIVDIKMDSGIEYVILEDKNKKKSWIDRKRIVNYLFTEDWKRRK